MNKRICVIPSWYPGPINRLAGIFVRDQVYALARQHEIDVVAPWMLNWRDWHRFRFGETVTHDPADPNVRIWDVRRCQWPFFSRWLGIVPRERDLARFFAQYCAAARQAFESLLQQERRPDLLHAHVVLPAGLVALQLGKQHSIPVVLTEHTGPFRGHLETSLQRGLVEQVLTGVDQVIAVSPSLADEMQAAVAGVPIHVVGNVVATDHFTPGAQDRSGTGFRFFFGGMHYREKGLHFLLEAARELRGQGRRSFEIILAGDGPVRAELERMAQAFELGVSCRFVGMLTRAQMLAQMQACDVFVSPSLGETFGMVLTEAMACGKPVLATRCGGPEYTVTPKTGTLVPPGDAAALARAMADFIDGKTVFDPKGIREYVTTRFGADAYLQAMNSIFDDVLARRFALNGHGQRGSLATSATRS